MQFSQVFFVAALASVAYSQSILDEIAKLPSCSLICLTTAATAAGCQLTDYACQCGTAKAAISESALPCVTKACQPSDLATLETVSTELCRIADAASGDSSSASGTATSAATDASSSASATASATASSSASSTASESASSTSAAAATTTPNAGSRFQAAGSVIGAAVAVAFAF